MEGEDHELGMQVTSEAGEAGETDSPLGENPKACWRLDFSPGRPILDF